MNSVDYVNAKYNSAVLGMTLCDESYSSAQAVEHYGSKENVAVINIICSV